MQKFPLYILFFLLSCTTESITQYDDESVLQDIINNNPDLSISLDIDSSGVIDPWELGEQQWDVSGRIIILNCFF